ncbi:MAG: hypothetical protein KDB22_10690 [Planctomycetales bacterium]|nr:hypothetical protein [Planctomycetales bacterium]
MHAMRSSGSLGLTALLVFVLCSATGCQTWNGGLPFQNPSRVPPRGTGTFPTPGNYYNNTSSVTPTGGVMPASAGSYSTNLSSADAVRSADFVAPSFARQPSSSSFDSTTGMQPTQPNDFVSSANYGGQFTDSSVSGGAGYGSDGLQPPEIEWQP